MNEQLTWDNVELLQPYSGWETDWGFSDDDEDEPLLQ